MMTPSVRGCAIVAGLFTFFVLAGYGSAQEPQPAAGNEVTLKANVLSNVHTGEREKSLFLIAYDGTPEIKAEFDKIVAEYYPDKGLDGEAARTLQDQFMTRLKYYIEGAPSDELYKTARYTVRTAMAVTGVISQRDGKKWITAGKAVPTTFAFPEKMLAPDKPFVMPDKEPLLLKINDTLSLKCIYVPSGKFLMGEPYYQCRHWQEDPPHMVTLTKSYYMAEHPVTEEIYAAVMGNDPGTVKDPKMPVFNVDCAGMYKFCDLLSAKTGRKVRVPTAAEWEYAARVGTSNPTFPQKYTAQNSNAEPKYMSLPLPVKSKAPNAWGFYDMHSGGWEKVSDAPLVQRQDEVDPVHIPPQDRNEATRGQPHKHFGKGQWTYEISEVEFIGSQGGRFRIVVEAEPAAPAPAAK